MTPGALEKMIGLVLIQAQALLERNLCERRKTQKKVA
jgi:hypothetical protein